MKNLIASMRARLELVSALVLTLVALLLMLAVAATPARAADTLIDGNLRMLCGTATGAAGAATLANKCGVITTESLSTAAGAVFTETITATGAIAAGDLCFASVASAGTGNPAVMKTTATANTLVILIQNIHAATAFNNTLQISYLCVRP